MSGKRLISCADLRYAAFFALLLIVAHLAAAQTETILHSFCANGNLNCTDGGQPQSRLTPDSEGNLYGSTGYGGQSYYGTVFQLSPQGSNWEETILYQFTGGTDGGHPLHSYLMFDSEGNLYGTASVGGAYGYGVVFELSPKNGKWKEKVLYSFAGGADGSGPVNGLIQDLNGNLYGVTEFGGNGTVFELSPSGTAWKHQVIYNTPIVGAGLVMDSSRNIFGASKWAVFELSPNGDGSWNPATIYTFKTFDKYPQNPEGTLVFDNAGNLYGTTAGSGEQGSPSGSVYKLTRAQGGSWIYEKIFDCVAPEAGVVLDGAGNIFGEATAGGGPNVGTLFELTGPNAEGKYKQVLGWTFRGPTGQTPMGGLILDSNDNIYGVTSFGGPSGDGLVFKVSPQPVVTVLLASPNPAADGQAVTFTASITSGAGAPPDGETVSFMQGPTTLGTGTLSGGTASFMTSTLKVGLTAVKAVYAGDSLFDGSTSSRINEVVKKSDGAQ